VGPRVGLDDVEKRKFLTLLGLELGPLGRPVRSQSQYRLRYPELNTYISLFVTQWDMKQNVSVVNGAVLGS
jgi:hypothetical protein